MVRVKVSYHFEEPLEGSLTTLKNLWRGFLVLETSLSSKDQNILCVTFSRTLSHNVAGFC